MQAEPAERQIEILQRNLTTDGIGIGVALLVPCPGFIVEAQCNRLYALEARPRGVTAITKRRCFFKGSFGHKWPISPT